MNSETPQLHWWQTGVVYQVYPRSFCDANGDGIGDLEGVIRKLDYLCNLGIDTIWLSPFYPSPMADFGYDVADYCDVDPMFGDLATFDRLVIEAHQRGLKVIIDWVPNHTSDQHAWFKESRSSRNNPKRDWYLWRDAKPDGALPNNWGSFFGGPAWTFDATTGQYYLHQFDPAQPELNWRNPDVKAAMLDTLRFWLRREVDGFRMDVVGLLIKDKDLRDNPPDPHAPADLLPNDLFGRQLHTYSEFQDENHAVVKEIRKTLDEFGDSVGIGELWGPLDSWVRYYGENGDELQLPFNFRLMYSPWDASVMRGVVDSLEAALPAGAWPNYVLGNHDQIRLASRFGGQAQARVAAMLLLTLRGTPTVYYGDELGMENVPIPPEKMVDPQGLRLGAHRSRDVTRTPMQWDASTGAGFSLTPAAAEPWLPVSADFPTRNVAVQGQDPCSILNLYRSLYQLRRASPALYAGSYQPLDSAHDCFVYLREDGTERRLVALNFSSEPRCVSAASLGQDGSVLLSTSLDRTGMVPLNAIELRPYEGLLIDCSII